MNYIKRLLVLVLLSGGMLFAGFSNVHCDNEGNLTVLHITQDDCQALEAFWDATGQGEGWTHNDNWGRLISAGEWYGITLTDDNTSVDEIFIKRNNLKGHIPPEIAKLKNLRRFIVPYNKLTGTIPPEIMNMPKI